MYDEHRSLYEHRVSGYPHHLAYDPFIHCPRQREWTCCCSVVWWEDIQREAAPEALNVPLGCTGTWRNRDLSVPPLTTRPSILNWTWWL
ncbi:hypothetical protein TNCV_2184441 [Trichonephila clavipes]|nr:hypothetical protein TNCV_2184441 [Trichonephila clavipes]